MAPAIPLSWTLARKRPSDNLPFQPAAFVFDVEGTLVDNVLATLQCWSETLAELGFDFRVADLHPFSGMDAKLMLRQLTRKHDAKLLDHLIELQGERYRKHYLAHVHACSGVRNLFTAIKSAKAKIALATSCARDELAHYRSLLNVDDLIDGAWCGDDVKRDKPHPDVISHAVKKLHLTPAATVMVGDTPSDAAAARTAGLAAIGLQSGHFSRSDLIDAGCAAVFFDLQSLRQKLQDRTEDRAEAASPLAAMQ